VGVILTLHHVRPRRPERFQPNRLLEVTPRFLEQVVRYLKRCQLDLVSLDEMHRRLAEGDFRRRFVCITIDDGYRDTLNWAYPILRRHAVPFALYIPTSFPDRLGELWWLALEAVVARNKHVSFLVDGREHRFDCASVEEKRHLYNELYGWVRSLKTEEELRRVVRELCARYQVDIAQFCEQLCMGWDELSKLAADPLVTIGAHTVNHVMLAKVPERSAGLGDGVGRSVIRASPGARPAPPLQPGGRPAPAGPPQFQVRGRAGLKAPGPTPAGLPVPSPPQPPAPLARISLNGEH